MDKAKNNHVVNRIVSIALLCAGHSAAAQGRLSAVALFHRCYGQITSQHPAAGDPLLRQIRDGSLTARQACMQVLARAKLTDNDETKIANPRDAVAKAVLHTFHKLHASWFDKRDMQVGINRSTIVGNRDLYDGSAPALYFTWALFQPSTGVRSVLTSTDNLRALRTDQNPQVGPASGQPKADSIFGAAVRRAPVGEMLGVEPTGDMMLNYDFDPRGRTSRLTGSAALGATLGGGVLGSPAFLLLNLGQEIEFRADGAIEMPRMWAKAIFSNLLCREIPVIRPDDAQPYVVQNPSRTNPPPPFRTSLGCVRCHATQDRMAATIRNVGFLDLTAQIRTEPPIGAALVEVLPTNQPAEGTWPTSADPSYFNRPPNGVIYYRDYQGALVDIPVRGPRQLGAALADRDDFYICAAKRYYQYFTGVDVDTGDLRDPTSGATLSARERAHRETVIGLGTDLKGHQSLMRLIGDILSLSGYAESDFGQ